MSKYWSTYVQHSEELYMSRALRFHSGNKDRWIEMMQLKNGMNVLEIGCGGGTFCNRIKEFLPDCTVTGLDFDDGHIQFAQEKSKELNLSCSFIQGDATKLPFESNTYDYTYSHTVIDFCDPDLFIKEQYRVLKAGGKAAILCPVSTSSKPEEWLPTDECEEKELFNKLWNEASKNDLHNIKRYESDPKKFFEHMEKQGFKDISITTMSYVAYAPDCANISEEMALAQISDDRMSEICSAKKAVSLAPNALTDKELDTLYNMINRRYDKIIDKYKNKEKSWEYRLSTVLCILGTK